MIKEALVGYTGFVGSNLAAEHDFDAVYNSKNIAEAFGTEPELLVYAGVPAQKFMANAEPEADLAIVENAIKNIKQISPRKIVLISTVDVLGELNGTTEDTFSFENGQAYGRNRRKLEEWVEENFDDYLIVRLPGLFGKNIKKNFIYDLINYVPSMLKEEKLNELASKDATIRKFYQRGENGFYSIRKLDSQERRELVKALKKVGFSALNFTDSRGRFQFYNLANLWEDIEKALSKGIRILHLATEPIQVDELYRYIFGEEFVNKLEGEVPNYDFRTKYNDFGTPGLDVYIAGKEEIMAEIKEFVESFRSGGLRLAISNLAWGKENDEKIYKLLQEKEIFGLEIAPTRIVEKEPYTADNVEKAQEILGRLKQKYGLEVVSMQSIWFGQTENIFENDEAYRKLRNYTFLAIDYARKIGCSNLVFGCPKNRRMSDKEKQLPIAIRFFNEIGEQAAENGVVIALEPNPTIYGTNFINTTSEAAEFIGKLSTDGVRINYDLGTVIENHESLEWLKNNIDLVSHIHVSEPGLGNIRHRKVHAELFEILMDVDYKGYVSIEMGKQEDIQAIEETVVYIKRLIAKCAE